MDRYNFNPENFDPESSGYAGYDTRDSMRYAGEVDRPETMSSGGRADDTRTGVGRRTRGGAGRRDATGPAADRRSVTRGSGRKHVARRRPGALVRFFTDSRLRGVLGVALIFFALYVLVSGISFVRTCVSDQSMASNMTVSEMAHASATGEAVVGNVGGPAGAKIAHALFTESFGLGTLVIIVYMTLTGLMLLKLYRGSFWSLTFKSLIDTVTLSLVAGLITYPMELSWPVGGYHGRFVNMWLIEHAGVIGVLLVNCMLIVCVAAIYLNELRLVINKYQAVKRHRRAMMEQRRQQELERQELVRRSLNDSVMGAATDSCDSRVESAQVCDEMSSMDFSDDSSTLTDTPEVDNERFMPVESSRVDLFAAPEPVMPNDDVADGGSVLTAPVAQAAGDVADLQLPTAAPAGVEGVLSVQPVADSAGHFEVARREIEQSNGPTVDESETYDPTAELSRYEFPPLDLLMERPAKAGNVDLDEQEQNKERITKTLNYYGIQIQRIRATVGPTVTLFEIVPAEGIRIAQIKRLEDDMALSLAAEGVRIIAPMPGKGTIGIEVANKDPQTVPIRTVLGSKAFRETRCALPMAMGATIYNEVFIADLAKMPHLLVAGATGQGKSVGLNTIIASLLYKLHPSRLKFVLVDPKSVEFSLYNKLERHYLAKLPDEEEPVVTAFDKVERTLNSLCVEMDNRYALLKDAGVRSLSEYNERFVNRRLRPDKGHRFLPYIVIIVDEFADLIMMSGKNIEMPIARIAQKARAVGMHLIIATQRPSTNVITGIIKANFPGRMAFKVSQGIDSKTILDRMGANQLIGRGDMLFSHNGMMDRVQCAFIDTEEVEAICEHINEQVGYEHAYYLPEPLAAEGDASAFEGGGSVDPLFEEAAQFIVSSGPTASTSSLQRRYSIGYNRAGKIMDQLESAGVVGPASGAKPRQVLLDPMTLDNLLRARRDA